MVGQTVSFYSGSANAYLGGVVLDERDGVAFVQVQPGDVHAVPVGKLVW